MKKRIVFLLASSICCICFLPAKAQQKITSKKQVTVYTSAKGTELRLSQNGRLSFKEFKQPLETEPTIFIDPSHTYQSFLGIGGALTDASAETFAKLPLQQQQEFLKAYYDPKDGIGYTIGRTNINSCDFSSGSYTYVDENDKGLKSFTIAHDLQYKIPFIKQAMAATGGKLLLFASPWSPPAWMKDNNDMLHGGKLKPESRQSWADYYVKFIKAYQAQGVPVWGLSVQNEPMAKQRWESCIFTSEEERDFIKSYLGPTLKKNGMSDKKLIAWDHNRDLMYQRASVILNDPAAAQYVWGIGYHWYETWTGGPMQFDNLKLVSQAFPKKNLMFTEGCKEKFNMDSTGNWSLGEKYAYSMINDFNSGTVAWTDWNVLLDEQGGPNHVGNFCFAPIHGDTKNGKLIYTNAYYYIGHFSKFIHRGAKRISASSSRAQLQTTAFQNTDGTIVVVVMNATDKKMPYHLWINGTAADTESLPNSISTLIIQ
jgi:glucosylceramidase